MTGFPIPRPRETSIKSAPDHHDAELVLRLCARRREPLLRESRRDMVVEFPPDRLEAALGITRSEHPGNAAYRQVTTYWEMAYGMARHGIVNPDYLVESHGEGLFVDEGRTLFGGFRQRVEARLAGAGSRR